MEKNLFFRCVVADKFFVSKAENIKVDHYRKDTGYFIFWEYAGRTNCEYIELSNIGDIVEVMKEWFPKDSETTIGWERIYKECCTREEQ